MSAESCHQAHPRFGLAALTVLAAVDPRREDTIVRWVTMPIVGRRLWRAETLSL